MVKRDVFAYKQERENVKGATPSDPAELYPCPHYNRSFRTPIAVISHMQTAWVYVIYCEVVQSA